MNKARHLASALGACAAVLIAVGCGESASPGNITAGVNPPPPNKGGGGCANFRLTGGGRTDDRSHVTAEKSTPESHDFATFGFQARPNGDCESLGGSGEQEWNEHNPGAVGGGFAFHGRVTYFTTGEGSPSECGTYGGYGRFNPRSGPAVDDVPFHVGHACDVNEPGVGQDHISIVIGPLPDGTLYERHGLLSGGNIQWHRLTGNN